ncbi:hypothetical protein HYV11_01920 [Candidatus Dependentiae bacterium]|nr:hypothetical protein [Candidatus Dependentiae bacterium]
MNYKSKKLIYVFIISCLLATQEAFSSSLSQKVTDLTIATFATLIKKPYDACFQWYYGSAQYQQALKELKKPFPPATETFKKLNENEKVPFAVSIGTALSQTGHTQNIIHPHYLGTLLKKESKKQKINAQQFLKDHWGYVVAATADIICSNCGTTTHLKTTKPTDPKINNIVAILMNDKTEKLCLSICPNCKSDDIKELPQTLHHFTKEQQICFVEQLKALGVFEQTAATQLPTYRLSLELSDLVNRDGIIDTKKLEEQATFVNELKNPLIFMHHYANPQCKPHLFEDKKDITWFANICAQFIEKCPHVTHVCPISQIMGFGLQVQRQSLPPFCCNIDKDQFLQNIVLAQVTASKAMKIKNPNLKVLLSHQWKPIKPLHGITDPRYGLEYLVCTIANRMYNQKLVQLVQSHQDSFDGIALSVYPMLYFDSITPKGSNTSGIIDPEAALEAIVQTHKAFPNKDIYIVETGCNSNDPEKKKEFVDMTLHVCQLARNMNIPVKTCFFWGHTNESYFEWNQLPNNNHFGAFESFSVDSINEYGKYLQSIVTQK